MKYEARCLHAHRSLWGTISSTLDGSCCLSGAYLASSKEADVDLLAEQLVAKVDGK